MNSISVIGKYLDQPRLVGKFSKAVPAVLVASGAAFAFNSSRTALKNEKRKEFVKSACVLTATIAPALLATRGMGKLKLGGKTIFKGFKGLSEQIDLSELSQKNTKLINEFVRHNNVSNEIEIILNKAKTKVLSPHDIKKIFEELKGNHNAKEFLSGEDGLIPDPENIDSKHIFAEIKRLSLMGLVPVLGGITGGVVGDKLTEKDWKDRIPNKIKEGSYQYLANIFLCNIGAGGALALMEKFKITSKAYRAVGMIAGIVAVGVIGGSAIANLIGRTCIDPLLAKKHKHGKGNCREHGCKNKGLYSERKPEALDVGLHIDDIATVAVLSGLKWIEPALPILYSISGYRAGIGYRNGDKG